MKSPKKLRIFLIFCLIGFNFLITNSPAYAASVDPVIRRYFGREPVEIKFDTQGTTHQFTPEEFNEGKELFDNSCINCHAGGLNIPYPGCVFILRKIKSSNSTEG
jgi:photosystem II cytochrome c550